MRESRFVALVALLVAAGCGSRDAATGPDTQGPPAPPPPPPVTTQPGAATALTFLRQPARSEAGTPIQPMVQVAIVDPAGNLVATRSDTVVITIGFNQQGATLTGTLRRAAVAGVATFDELRIDQPGLGYVLAADAPGLKTGLSTNFEVFRGPPHP